MFIGLIRLEESCVSYGDLKAVVFGTTRIPFYKAILEGVISFDNGYVLLNIIITYDFTLLINKLPQSYNNSLFTITLIYIILIIHCVIFIQSNESYP